MGAFVNLRDQALVRDAAGKEMSGGEGVVWAVEDRKGAYPFRTVAKIYHKPPSADQKAKLKTMLRLPADQRNGLLQFSTWPLAAAFEAQTKALSGYVMPLAGDHKDIHKLYNPKDRRAHFPQADWSFLGCAAMNVARAFAEVHRFGHVAGDINHSNILISSDARALLIDTDSFQISAGGKTFRCKVGVPDFLPPELFQKDLKRVTRTANHDNFSIAVMIFLLLCNGWHPFSGQDTGARTLSLNEAVERSLYAFGRSAASKGIAPPPAERSIHPLDLPKEVVELFERAFAETAKSGGRPTALEWAQTLQHAFLGNLKACRKNARHHFVSGHACPWCRLDAHRRTPVFGAAPRSSRPKAAALASLVAKKSSPAPPRGVVQARSYTPPKARTRKVAAPAAAAQPKTVAPTLSYDNAP